MADNEISMAYSVLDKGYETGLIKRGLRGIAPLTPPPEAAEEK
jgi:hypothetical protein